MINWRKGVIYMDTPFNLSNMYDELMSDITSRAVLPYNFKAEMDTSLRNPVIPAFENIKEAVEKFQESLDDDHEVGMQLASFNQRVLLNVTHIDYSAPTLMNFYGFVDGNRAHLIQHISQLNFLLVAVPKSEPDKPARRIGFDAS
jgi:hypothetical protein